MTCPAWWTRPPFVVPTAVNVGAVDLELVKEGSVNIGVSFMTGGGSGGGIQVSNELVGMQGDFATSWVNNGLILSTVSSDMKPEEKPGMASKMMPKMKCTMQTIQTFPPRQMAQSEPVTFEFRFNGKGEVANKVCQSSSRFPGSASRSHTVTHG